MSTLEKILSEFGEVNKIGKSYGILKINGIDVDFSIPRIEYIAKITNNTILIPDKYSIEDLNLIRSAYPNYELKISNIEYTHTNFIVIPKYDISIKEVSRRRDFTINAIYENVLSGTIIDCCNGIYDLKNGIIRHIDKDTFIEDPLRVLRACQFAARFNFTIDKDTLSLCHEIDITSLPKERIFIELKKALLKADMPSLFFKYLLEMGQLKYFFYELILLINCPQNKKYHPEGDVWSHTMLVIDQAAKLRDKTSTPLAFMLSALCHDLGKPKSTVFIEGDFKSYDHNIIGVTIAKQFLNRFTTNIRIINYVLNMVECHMRPHQLIFKATDKAIRKLINNSINIDDLILLSEADSLGRGNKYLSYNKERQWFKDKINNLYKSTIIKLVTGKDLIDLGFKEGKVLGEKLKYAYELQLEGLSREEILNKLI